MTEGKVLTSSEVLALGENGINGDERPGTAVVRPLDQENDLGAGETVVPTDSVHRSRASDPRGDLRR